LNFIQAAKGAEIEMTKCKGYRLNEKKSIVSRSDIAKSEEVM